MALQARLIHGLAWFICVSVVPVLVQAAEFELSTTCPPGFELIGGQCKLRSLYQMYPSLEDAGVGGLKTGLPAYRDGFNIAANRPWALPLF